MFARSLFAAVLLLSFAAHDAHARLTHSRGVASWYGAWHEGRTMANGKPFHAAGLTAAHRTLPLGARVRVRSLATKRSVVVRITDRGPYVGHRVLDLSQGAARRLGVERAGLAVISLEVVSEPHVRR